MRFFKKYKIIRLIYKNYVKKIIFPVIKIINRGKEGVNYFYDRAKPKMPSDQVRLVIFGQGRTGSTLLESLISSTGHFRSYGELFNTQQGEILYPTKFIQGLAKRLGQKNFIFHVKIYHLTSDRKHPIDPAAFLKKLNDDGWKIIYLRRKNKVKHCLSNLIAEHRASPHKFGNYQEKIELYVNCSDFAKGVKGRFNFDEAEEQALSNVNYLKIVYEDDLEKPALHQNTIDKIMDYVSLEKRKVATKYKKIYRQPLEEIISNYDEFVKCLEKNQWQKFLEY